MTIEQVREALQDLHQEKADLIKATPVEWPQGELDPDDLPLILVKRGPARWHREGTVVYQTRTWMPWVYLIESNQETLALAENWAIRITQQLGEIYIDPDNQTLHLGGDCDTAEIVQAGENAIGDTELGELPYWGKTYYGLQFELTIVETTQ